MAGDKLNVQTGWWYRLAGADPANTASPLTDIVAALSAGIPGISSSKIAQSQVAGTTLNPAATSFLTSRDANTNTARPRAWLNIMVFDEQMNLVNTNDGKNSYYQQVAGGNTANVQYMTVSQREITKSGYVYIYVSNESTDVNVYFDNLQVTQVRSALLQEQAYYPFGLEMKGISSQAAGASNNYKFNGGVEINESFDVDYYETSFRRYDCQVGRFTGIDALSEKNFYESPFAFAGNNPISLNDPSGLKKKAQQDNSAWVAATLALVDYANSQSGACMYSFSATGGEGGGASGGLVDFNDDNSSKNNTNNRDGTPSATDLLVQIIKTAGQIQEGKYGELKNVKYNGSNPTYYQRDISEMKSTLVGAMVLAIIENFGIKVTISDVKIEGFFSGQLSDKSESVPIVADGALTSVDVRYFSPDALVEIDGAKFNGSTILFHELFHAVDIISQGTGKLNYLSPFDKNSKAYYTPQYADNFGGNPYNFYTEVRAVMFENQFRMQSKSGLGARYNYGGIDLTKWLDYPIYQGQTWRE